MKPFSLITFLFLLITVSAFSAAHAQTDQPVVHRTSPQVLDIWIANTETHLVPLADAMPEEKYSFAPTNGEFKGVRTFGEQVKHLASFNYLAFSQMNQMSSLAQQTSARGQKKESPFACDTLALTPEIRKQHFEVLGPALVAKRKAVRELPNGYEFEFPNDENTYKLLTQWVFQESQCCPFFDLSVRLEREHGALIMTATGREGTKAFIQSDGAKWIQPVKAEMK